MSMYCSACGAELEDKAGVCAKCGAPVPGRMRPHVSDHSVLAILTTLFCCQIVGLIAVLRSGEVNARLQRDDVEGARLASRSVLRLCLFNIAACVILLIAGSIAVTKTLY